MSSPDAKGRSINAKQARFVAEYLIDLNATQAAIRSGYSPKTANEQGSRLLANVKVSAALSSAQAERSKRTEITQDMVLQEYAKIGFSDIRKIAKWGERPIIEDVPDDYDLRIYPVELIASETIDDATAAAISEVSLTAQGVKVKMYDKKGALDSIARHLGMFNDKLDHTSSDGSMAGASALERINSKLARLADASNPAGDTSGSD